MILTHNYAIAAPLFVEQQQAPGHLRAISCCRDSEATGVGATVARYSNIAGYTFISTSTPAGKSSFIRESTVLLVELRISIRRLCARVSNCSLDFLST